MTYTIVLTNDFGKMQISQDYLLSIAIFSNFVIRQIALGEDWVRQDNSPLYGKFISLLILSATGILLHLLHWPTSQYALYASHAYCALNHALRGRFTTEPSRGLSTNLDSHLSRFIFRLGLMDMSEASVCWDYERLFLRHRLLRRRQFLACKDIS